MVGLVAAVEGIDERAAKINELLIVVGGPRNKTPGDPRDKESLSWNAELMTMLREAGVWPPPYQ